ncbi:ABC-type uncharacterized transport system involved in gliding motility auxiliary subunit [Chryseobacterium rhizosphaerae]|nr:ABC-type uncharacterized transport system involved in gliding motility auxiliary subunit [Chryseobacterium rhizosphaerae]
MSLKIYTIINSFIFSIILLMFSLVVSISICITQCDFNFLYLYLFRGINHIFESFNLFSLVFFFISSTLITYYLKKTRTLFFCLVSSLILGVFLNMYDIKALFIYKSQPIDRYFYIYLISYMITSMIWYILLKKVWKNMKIA